MAKTQTTEANAAAFTKAQLVASQRYVHRRDLIGALLEDGKTYTLNEVDALIEKFMKGDISNVYGNYRRSRNREGICNKRIFRAN